MDARAQRTVGSLREALIRCMEADPVKDIRATDICERAGLNKTTFYKYYKDVDAMVCELELEQLDRFALLLQQSTETGEALLREILDSIDRAQELYHTGSGGALSESFRRGLIKTAKKYGMKAWKQRLPGTDEHEAELAYEGLLAGALQVALAAGERTDREKVVKTIMNMVEAYISANS